MRFQTVLDETVNRLRAERLLREPDDGEDRRQVQANATQLGVSVIDASSNDYLGLARQAVSRETPVRPGASASRLVHGTTPEHVDLERQLASWVNAESSLLFTSTYAANLGLISALGVPDSVILSDAANHASLIDGARLARAEVRVLPHLDLDALRQALRERRSARACWVITESYFSMDGDGPDLLAVRDLCAEYDGGLIVDEAHALGVFGPRGAGRCAEVGIRPDALSGALGKAVGSHGGFVAGSLQLRTFLWNKARSFVFSTAPSPQHAAVTAVQVQRTLAAEEARARLAEHSATLRRELSSAGLRLAPGSFGPIVSVILGENQLALDAASKLRKQGILAQAIRPPTVPAGSARLRLTVKADFSNEEVQRLGRAVAESCLES